MAQVRFTSSLRELVPDAAIEADGATVGDALTRVFETLPQVRGYMLDDRGHLRKHVCVFADGARLPRETRDGGARWTLLGDGLVAAYLPPENAGDRAIQDPHRGGAARATAPETMWMQHHNGIFRSTDAGVSWTQLRLPG